MTRASRFLVNAFNAPRNRRLMRWMQERASLPPGAAWLEVGCGNGDLAARVVDTLGPARYVATDLDTEQIEVAKAHLAKRYPDGLPRVLELRTADMLHLPFEDASFDAVLAVVAIHHATPDHHESAEVPNALAQLDRVIRPGGALLYEEILHKDLIRAWLAEHGYVLSGVERGFKRESVVARKPARSA